MGRARDAWKWRGLAAGDVKKVVSLSYKAHVSVFCTISTLTFGERFYLNIGWQQYQKKLKNTWAFTLGLNLISLASKGYKLNDCQAFLLQRQHLWSLTQLVRRINLSKRGCRQRRNNWSWKQKSIVKVKDEKSKRPSQAFCEVAKIHKRTSMARFSPHVTKESDQSYCLPFSGVVLFQIPLCVATKLCSTAQSESVPTGT